MNISRIAGLTGLALSLVVSGAVSAASSPEEAGTVTLAVGDAYATGADGTRRALKDEDPVYAGDTLSTGAESYIDVDLDDDGRLLLRPGTQFEIQSYHFEPAAHPEDAPPTPAAAQESAFFKLIKGGLRIVSGLIGHVQHDRYGVNTPVATIGIRGTEYDLRYCAADCADEADAGHAPADGLYTGVSKGAIAVHNQAGETVTPEGQYTYVHDARTPLSLLKTPPPALRHMDLPEKYKKLEEERERRGLHHHHDKDRDRDRHRHRHHRPGAD